jgi:pyruvate, water dikinase
MFDIKGYFRRRAEGKVQQAERERQAIRLAFTNRYLNFKTLLSINDKVLEIINEMEEALQGSRPFGIAFIRGRCTALSVNLFKIIQSLNEITDGRGPTLLPAFDKIWEQIDRELKRKKKVASGPWILPLEELTKDMADRAGNKMAYLGEIKNRLAYSVPPGFVITSAAYEHFMETSGIQEEINRRLQFLEPEDLAQLHEASAEIQKLIVQASVPGNLEEAIFEAYRALRKKTGEGVQVSLRSSALGEDAEGASFAGQYRSMLNVSQEYLILSYKEIVASKYSVPAMSYRLNMGFLDEDILMCVGCMAMIQPTAAGVLYSRDPGDVFEEAVVINAVWGLGKAVVDGSLTPDLIVVDKHLPTRILKKEIQKKEKKIVCDSQEGVVVEMLSETEQETPALTDPQARQLADMAIILEKHFGAPQDIEWAIDPEGTIQILQSRPLLMLGREKTSAKKEKEENVDLPLLVEGGVTASPGVAFGQAFYVETAVDMLQFPEGGVLVAKNPLPQWAALLNRARALVTDQGALTGHLAAVAREFKVPALMGTLVGSQKICSHDFITVDADRQRVYAGKAEALLAQALEKSNPIKGSPVYQTLEQVLSFIAPLNLTDPEAPNFSPEGCRSLHDVIRYAHEMSLRELFDENKEVSFSEKLARKLISGIPMQWWVLDLEGGIKEGAPEGPTIRIEDIVSAPLMALWEGLKAVPWKGPPAVDAKGFMSILAESTMDPSLEAGQSATMAGKNFLIISRDFFHLSTKLGFHFSTVEAFLGDQIAENYIWFYFKGGAADRQRKEQRSLLIRTILETFHFWVQVKGDMLSARLERQEKGYLIDRLKVLGYLILHTRQLDMVLSDTGRVNWYKDQMLNEISTLLLGKP